MTTLDDRMVPLARRMIDKYGKAMTFTKITPGSYNPATSATTGVTTTDYATKGVMDSSRKYFGDDLVQEQDVTVLMAADGMPSVTPGDQIMWDGTLYSVVVPRPIYSGEQIALYIMLAR